MAPANADDLTNLLAPILLDSTLTLQESLINAEAVYRLSSVIGSVSQFLPPSVVSQWFARFIQTVLHVLKSGSPLPSLFSFVQVLTKQAYPALQLPTPDPQTLSSEEVNNEESVPRKRIRRSTMDVEMDKDGMEQQSGQAKVEVYRSVELLKELCDEVISRLVQMTGELKFNALELLLAVPDSCITNEVRLRASESNYKK